MGVELGKGTGAGVGVGAGAGVGDGVGAGVGAGIGGGVQLIPTKIKTKLLMVISNNFFALVISHTVGYALHLLYTPHQLHCQCCQY